MKVVHCKNEPYEEYIGRGSIFGNPYIIGRHGTREECVQQYKEWFNFLLRDKRFVKELVKLKGKVLGCFCNPGQLCHGEIILTYLDNYGK